MRTIKKAILCGSLFLLPSCNSHRKKNQQIVARNNTIQSHQNISCLSWIDDEDQLAEYQAGFDHLPLLFNQKLIGCCFTKEKDTIFFEYSYAGSAQVFLSSYHTLLDEYGWQQLQLFESYYSFAQYQKPGKLLEITVLPQTKKKSLTLLIVVTKHSMIDD